MKQLKALLICSLFLLLPRSVYALEGELSITCDSQGLYKTEDTNCTISGTTDEVVTGLEGVLAFSEDVEISNFTFTSDWLSMTAISTVTSGVTIEAIASAEQGHEDINGDFTLATFKARLNEEATSYSQEITISSIKFYDANVNTVIIEDDATITFEDFMEISDYTVDEDKEVIYRLRPMTVGAFKQNIVTNVFYGIYDAEDNLIEDAMALKTGYFFRTTLMNVNYNYKISVLGDVLGEGHSSTNGARTIARHIIDGNVLSGDEVLLSADINDDKTIKMNDVMRMLSEIED